MKEKFKIYKRKHKKYNGTIRNHNNNDSNKNNVNFIIHNDYTSKRQMIINDSDNNSRSNIISNSNTCNISNDTSTVIVTSNITKLTKQERRNRNKQLKNSVNDNNICNKNNNNNRFSLNNIDNIDVTSASNVGKNGNSENIISVYKRDTVYPPSYINNNNNYQGKNNNNNNSYNNILYNRFITPHDKEYLSILKQCYNGFHIMNEHELSLSFHQLFQISLKGLEKEGFFQYDITQPTGLNSKLSKTFVTRCVVGDAGITYKYLGLRMFSIPWDDNSDNQVVGYNDSKVVAKDDDDVDIVVDDDAIGFNNDNNTTAKQQQQQQHAYSKYAKNIKVLNDEMISHSSKLLKGLQKEQVGSCQYNLTLINRCIVVIFDDYNYDDEDDDDDDVSHCVMKKDIDFYTIFVT
jgi:hypothetical protein